ncbi:urease accessory protein UreE [Labrys neptuniae]|uniref:Urease accessory protein UreE n=1 Tax=Labrys neptuniae TaxID=376174 RepID=A0ABV3PNT4_9HYPH
MNQDRIGRVVIGAILGNRAEAAMAAQLHDIGHDGGLETLMLAPVDLPRRRFHAVTQTGTQCFIQLPRDSVLFDGAVIYLENRRAIVVHVGEQRWLRLRPAAGAELELGYLAGNLHWRVRFEGGVLLVALDGPIESYQARLRDFLERGKVTILE